MSLRLTLICNAATAATRAAAFADDEALEPFSAVQAAALGASFAPILARVDQAWTSPALRARQTAALLGLDATETTALADLDLGRWAGQSLAAVERDEPTALGQWVGDPETAPHGGESIAALVHRVGGWMAGLEALATGAAPRHVAVTHAAIIRAALLVALEAGPRAFWRIDVEPLCVARLQGQSGRWTIRSFGRLAEQREA